MTFLNIFSTNFFHKKISIFQRRRNPRNDRSTKNDDNRLRTVFFLLCWHLKGHRNVGIFDTFLRVLIHKSTPQFFLEGGFLKGRGWVTYFLLMKKFGREKTGELGGTVFVLGILAGWKFGWLVSILLEPPKHLNHAELFSTTQ